MLNNLDQKDYLFELYKIEDNLLDKINGLEQGLENFSSLGFEIKKLRRLGRKRTGLILTLLERLTILINLVLNNKPVEAKSNFSFDLEFRKVLSYIVFKSGLAFSIVSSGLNFVFSQIRSFFLWV